MTRVCPFRDALCPNGMACDKPCAIDRFANTDDWNEYRRQTADMLRDGLAKGKYTGGAQP